MWSGSDTATEVKLASRTDTVNDKEQQPRRDPEMILVPGHGMREKLLVSVMNALRNGGPRWVQKRRGTTLVKGDIWEVVNDRERGKKRATNDRRSKLAILSFAEEKNMALRGAWD
jgi:hypothetical protein